jgi:hypothetical protein
VRQLLEQSTLICEEDQSGVCAHDAFFDKRGSFS